MKRMFELGAVVATVVLGLGTPAQAKGKPGGSPNSNAAVTITFRDDPLDNIRSDGQGAYVDGVDGVGAAIGSSDGILLFGQGTRKLYFQFTDCLDPVACDRPFLYGESATQNVNKTLTVDSTAFAPHGLLGIPVGEERRIFMKQWLRDLPNEWTVCLNPPGVADLIGICSVNTVGTAARVQRTSQGTWVIFSTAEPDAAGNPSDRAGLVHQIPLDRHKVATTTEGPYSMPFQMTVTCVNEADCPVLPE